MIIPLASRNYGLGGRDHSGSPKRMKVNQSPILVKNQDFGIKNTIAQLENSHGLDPEPDRLGSDSRDQ